MNEEKDDKTSQNEDELDTKDLKDLEEEDDFDSEDDKEGDDKEGGDKESDKKDDKGGDTVESLQKKLSSALTQKGKWRDKYNEIIKDKDDKPSPKDDRKETVKGQLKALLKEITKEEKAKDKEVQDQFDDELEDVLTQTNHTEAEIVEVCEEFSVSPKIALKILNKSGKDVEKPKDKNPKRGSTGEDKEKERPKTFAEAAKRAKERINEFRNQN